MSLACTRNRRSGMLLPGIQQLSGTLDPGLNHAGVTGLADLLYTLSKNSNLRSTSRTAGALLHFIEVYRRR